MPIAHYGPAQADVYIPAIIALTVGAAVVGVLLVLLPRLRGGAGLAAKIGAGVLVAATVVVAVALLVPAQRSLAAQVPALQQRIAARYGLHLPAALVSDLIGGDTLKAAQVSQYTHAQEDVKLAPSGSGYELVGVPTAEQQTTELPLLATGS